MIYLLLAIISSASIALVFKYSETNQLNRYGITTVNYLTAFIVSLFLFITETNKKLVTVGELKKGFNPFIQGELNWMTPTGSIYWAMVIGILAGFIFYASFIFYQESVKEHGASLSGMFGKLGILVPMIISIILWKEWPNFYQWIGIILSIITIILVNLNFKQNTFKWKISLILLLLFGGLAEFSNKFYIKYALEEYKSLFLFFVFFTAFIVSLFKTIRLKKRLTKRDLITGFLVGVPNLFSSFFLILALRTITTSVAFTLFSAGSIVVIIIGSRLLYQEFIKKKEWIAIMMTLVAILLVNM